MNDSLKQITKRLRPRDDLRNEIESLVNENKIAAGCLLSVVGSLSNVCLRVADGKIVKCWAGEYEIVSGTGTLSQNDCHVHISVADKEGIVIGGHLKPGCLISTTAEISVLVFNNVMFKRVPDEQTGYDELVVE